MGTNVRPGDKQPHPVLLGLLLALATVRGTFYALIIPPWQSPDETGHFEYAWHLATLRRTPTAEEVSPTLELGLLSSLYEWRFGEFTQRPLPEQMPEYLSDLPASIRGQRSRTVFSERFSLAYVWPALVIWPVRFQDLTFQLFCARLSSVVLNTAIVWLAFLTFRELAPLRPRLYVLMTAVVVFLPQHTYINSTVGEGPLAELMACLVFLCWVRLFGRGFGLWETAGVTLGTLASIWSKSTAFFLVPLDIALTAWWLMRSRGRPWTRLQIGAACATMCLLGLALWAWTRSTMGVRILRMAGNLLDVRNLVWVDKNGFSFLEGLLLSYDSFWASFGWLVLPVDRRWYGGIMVFTLLSVAGWAVGPHRKTKTLSWQVGLMGASLVAAVLVFAVGGLLIKLYYWIQGRYLFPAVVPYVFLLVGGIDRLSSLRGNRTITGIMMMLLICFDTWCLAGHILPYFYAQ